jgi:hypothetical protein
MVQVGGGHDINHFDALVVEKLVIGRVNNGDIPGSRFLACLISVFSADGSYFH